MPREPQRSLAHLSRRERAVVGSPDDYAWAEAEHLPAREKPDMTQISLRVEREVLERLQALAASRSATVSDLARDALARFVASGGRPAISNIQVTFAKDAGMLVTVEGMPAELASNRNRGSREEWIRLPAK